MSKKLGIIRISFEKLKELLHLKDDIDIDSVIFTHKDAMHRSIRFLLQGETFHKIGELEEPHNYTYDYDCGKLSVENKNETLL